MNWLPLSDAYGKLLERGLGDAAAAEGLTSAISTGAMRIRPARSFDRQCGPSWITNPALDFRAGTIALPLVPTPGSWDVINRRLTAVLVSVDADQFDRLWPAPVAPELHARFARDDVLALEGKAGLQSIPPRWPNVHQAAIELAARAEGTATTDSKVRRIEGKISKSLETSRNISKD
jgi:hypothetical protein